MRFDELHLRYEPSLTPRAPREVVEPPFTAPGYLIDQNMVQPPPQSLSGGGEPVVEALSVADYRALLSGATWNGPGVSGRPVILTYSFNTAWPVYSLGSMESIRQTFQPFNESDKTMARAALAEWGAASGILFLEVEPGQGDIQFAVVNFNANPSFAGYGGVAYYPSVSITAASAYSAPAGGDVLIDAGARLNGEFYRTLLHEIGHALGFKHAQEGDPILTPEAVASQETVMWNTGSRSTIGALDAAAAAHLYGPPSADGTHVASWSWNAATQVLTQTGGAGADAIRGVFSGNIISGLDGDDVLLGGYGVDTLDGGPGADVLAGLEGNDILNGGLGADTLYGGDGDDTLLGGDGNDNLYGGFSGSGGRDSIQGGAGNDRLEFFAPFALADGGEGQDTLSLVGTQSNTGVTVFFSEWTAGATLNSIESVLIWGGGGNDILVGGALSDQVLGGAGADFLDGLGGADTLWGGDGDDTIVVGAGDYLDGGSGLDIADFRNAVASVTLTLPLSNASITAGGMTATFSSIEGLTGSAFADVLTGNAANNILAGGQGADRVFGGDGADIIVVRAGDFIAGDQADGGTDVDTLQLVGASDFRVGALTGFERFQFVRTGAETTINIILNASQLAGFAANTVVSGSAAQDSIQIFAGLNGSVNTSGWAFEFPAWGFDDYIVYVGDAGAEAFTGFAGLDIFFGSPGEDVYDGRGAFDFAAYLFSPNAVQADLAISGRQEIGGNQGFDTFINLEGLAGSQFSDLLYGDGGANIILGLYGNDLLVGRAGDDDLRGAEGSDRIEGGMGADVLWGFTDLAGGADGSDTFVYRTSAEGGDTIRDFVAGQDLIEVSASGFGGGLAAGQAVTLVSGAAPTASGASGQFLYNTSNGQLSWDADGSGAGAAVLLATFLGNPALTSGSIIVTGIAASAALEDAQPPSAFAAEGDDAAEQDTFDFYGVAAAPSHAPQAFGGGGAFGIQLGAWVMTDPLDTFAFADGVGGFMSGEIGSSLADMLDVQRGALGPDAMNPI